MKDCKACCHLQTWRWYIQFWGRNLFPQELGYNRLACSRCQ